MYCYPLLLILGCPLILNPPDTMANFVLDACKRSVAVKAKCGSDLKIRRCWLDLDFPYGPPPEYERTGYVFLFPSVRVSLARF